MKRIMSLLLLIAMVLSISACGSNISKEDKPSATDSFTKYLENCMGPYISSTLSSNFYSTFRFIEDIDVNKMTITGEVTFMDKNNKPATGTYTAILQYNPRNNFYETISCSLGKFYYD